MTAGAFARRALVGAGLALGVGVLVAAAETPSDFAGLPEGPGREAVYYTCRACHSEKQFTQQRLSREAWDELLTQMVENNGMEPPAGWARTLMLNYLTTHFGEQAEDDWAGLPAGRGREEVFYLCQACHSLAIVKQQGLSRPDWDETLDWMVEEQGMPEPEPAEREALLDYLADRFGPDRGTGGAAAN